MRIVILGANGPTGRLLTGQALTAGHRVVALTRRRAEFPLRDPGLDVVGGDVLDEGAVDSVVEGSDAVLSTLGAPFSKEPVEVYSRGVENTLEAMKRYGVPRLVVVSSGAVAGEDEPTGGFLFNRVLQPYVTKVIGRTVYDDMRRMEALVTSSDTDWTILRPSGLYDLPEGDRVLAHRGARPRAVHLAGGPRGSHAVAIVRPEIRTQGRPRHHDSGQPEPALNDLA